MFQKYRRNEILILFTFVNEMIQCCKWNKYKKSDSAFWQRKVYRCTESDILRELSLCFSIGVVYMYSKYYRHGSWSIERQNGNYKRIWICGGWEEGNSEGVYQLEINIIIAELPRAVRPTSRVPYSCIKACLSFFVIMGSRMVRG